MSMLLLNFTLESHCQHCDNANHLRDDAIFSGESLLQVLKNLFLPNQFQKWSNSVPLIGQKNIFLPNERGALAG